LNGRKICPGKIGGIRTGRAKKNAKSGQSGVHCVISGGIDRLVEISRPGLVNKTGGKSTAIARLFTHWGCKWKFNKKILQK
jgi:hypothetical protein